MSVSESLRKLSERAKVAEDRATAAKTQARTDLERTVDDVRASAEAEGKKIQAQAQQASTDMSGTWDDVQRSWNAHLDKVKSGIQHRKAELDASGAENRAEWAETDALLAIDYAYAAIEEAEYVTLDAILARREAEDLAVAATR